MSVELACHCDDLPAHSHVYGWAPELDEERQLHTMTRVDTGEARIWVDWKQVARELALSDPVPNGRP